MDDGALIRQAEKAREAAYAPYSGYRVGAALLCEDGKVYTGCNIENAAYSPSNCAERTAFFKAVSDGAREFAAIAVAAGPPIAYPCGVCRQVMAEFCGPSFRVLVSDMSGGWRDYTLEELLPHGFRL